MAGPSLQDLFAERVLVRPSDAQTNLVHIVRAIATACGAADFRSSRRVQELLARFGDAPHLVFILLDGLGMMLVRHLPESSFLRRHLIAEINAACPSTTACALTSVATAEYANCHGVTGWFTYLPELELTATVLPFVERFTNQPLTARGIRVEDVLRLHAICGRMKRDVLTIVPAIICDTVYNTYARGGTRGLGYHSFHHAFEEVAQHLSNVSAPTYTHVYLPEVDSQCHKSSVSGDDVMPLVMKIDAELTQLAERVRGLGARIIVSADHGLIDVPRQRQQFLLAGDPMLELLRVPPSGDARMPVFHVKPQQHAAFRELFHARYGEQMVLVSTEQAEQLELFGCGAWSAWAKPRFGDLIAFPHRPATLAYHPPDRPLGHVFLAVHGGLSPQEMQVPLCIA